MSESQIVPPEEEATLAAPATPDTGAQFWAYLSPSNDTDKVVTDFTIVLTQGSWSHTLTPAQQTLQTEGLSGLFEVRVSASFAGGDAIPLGPGPEYEPNVVCNADCSSMIGIVANLDGKSGYYWTTWNAICHRKFDFRSAFPQEEPG